MVGVLRWTLIGAGVAALVLGLMLWSGRGYALVNLHMVLGVVMVVALWVLAGLALGRGTQRGLAVAALVWGLLTPLVGFWQIRLLPGEYHIVVQLVHLLLGVGAVAIGNRLATGLPKLLESRASR